VESTCEEPMLMNNRIYIVEDDPVTAKMLEKIVSKNGYEIAGLSDNAEEAVIEIRELKPDLVLMDILLKGEMNGIQASRIINEEAEELPVIFITVVERSEITEQIKKSILKGYINKPFTEEDVLTIIRKSLNE
jgi:CheY-like chemotaxis protein